MSSEISTDASLLASGSGDGKAQKRATGLQPWQLFTLAGLISAAIVAFYAGAYPPSVRVALILTVFAAAAIGVAALRTLEPFTGRVKPEASPVVGGRTRAALEREKTLLIRSLKELEFDRAMGKVSEKDFTEMSTRLRARAARILRQLDAGVGYRQEIEQEVAKRLAAATPATSATPVATTPDPDDEAGTTVTGNVQNEAVPQAAGLRDCVTCGTANDPDARFCKSCGGRLEAA